MTAFISLPVDRVLSARLLNTHLATGGLRLTDVVLQNAARDAKSMTIISAFYDLKWCRELIANAGVQRARMVVNGLGGARLARQRHELSKLKRQLAKQDVEADIRLAFAPGIFHSKLVLIEHGRRQVAFIGSANATSAAMERNEEIVLRITGDLADLIRYADKVCEEHSISVDDETDLDLPKSLVAFFRTGSLYFRSNASLQLTLNPFRELERRLPQKVKKRLGSVSLPYTERKTGIGPFSLVRALKLDPERRSAPAKLRRFAIETSLGYWVPDALAAELRDELKNATRARRRSWDARRETILATEFDVAKGRYRKYLDAIHEKLREAEISIDLGGAPDPLAVDRFDGFFNNVCRRLKNDAFHAKLIDPFLDAAVPEIWDDPLARSEFEDSFFGYLEYVAGLPKQPRVPRTILREVGSPTTREEIKKGLRRRLKDGWQPEVWE